jgi:nucleotide-binding universal stress UspA family protein
MQCAGSPIGVSVTQGIGSSARRACAHTSSTKAWACGVVKLLQGHVTEKVIGQAPCAVLVVTA